MKFGDAVIYNEFGKLYNALVLEVRDLENHAGSNGEPLVHLVFAREVTDMHGKPQNLAGTGSAGKLLQFRHDVAHESHEYSQAYKDATKKNRYEGGRWSVPAPPAQPAAESDIPSDDSETVQ